MHSRDPKEVEPLLRPPLNGKVRQEFVRDDPAIRLPPSGHMDGGDGGSVFNGSLANREHGTM